VFDGFDGFDEIDVSGPFEVLSSAGSDVALVGVEKGRHGGASARGSASTSRRYSVPRTA